MPRVPAQLLVVGVGLIGGSFALGLKVARADLEIIGTGRCVDTLQKAVEIGAIDRYETDLSKAAARADIVLLAVPMTAMRSVLKTLRLVLRSGAIITDAGSVKSSFIDDARQVLGDLSRVVPGHPIAGAENSGINAASPTLFKNRRVVLTPQKEVSPAVIEQVAHLWRLCGAEIELMDADDHDRILAATSHLPHILAYSLVDTLLCLPERESAFRYSAGGFRDFTRIASSDPVMWRDICLSNREYLLPIIDSLQTNLNGLRDLIARGEGEALHAIFSRTKSARDGHYN